MPRPTYRPNLRPIQRIVVDDRSPASATRRFSTSDHRGDCTSASSGQSDTTATNAKSVFTTLVGGRVDANVGAISADVTAADNAEAFFDGTGYAGTGNVIPTVTTVTGLAAGAITAASVATGAIDADAIAADAVTEIQAGLATAAALATVQADTDDIQARLPAALTAGGNMKADALALSGDTVAADNAEAFFDGTGYAGTGNTIPTVTTVTGLAAGAITAAAIAANAIDADALATDAVAEIADGVWDELTTGHLTSGTFGQALAPFRAGTAQAGAGTTITLDAGASAVDDFYNNTLVVITAGTGAGQARFISDYVGATKVATVNTWATNPSSDSVFFLMPFGAVPGAVAPTAADVADAVWDELRAAHLVAGSFGEGVALSAAAVAAILDDAIAEPAGIFAWPATLRSILAWIGVLSRNKINQTATAQAVRNDADAGTIATATVSDDGVTFVRGEFS